MIQILKPKEFTQTIFQLNGISKKTIEEHLKLYQGYVNKYNEITEKLANLDADAYTKSNQIFSTMRELKLELSFAWGGVVNHEIYFTNLGGTRVPDGTRLKTSSRTPDSALLVQIKKDFGSYDLFLKDLKATGLSARGWVWTVWNEREKKLFNHLGDAQNTFAFWEGQPIIALDVYEHAYFIDYGIQRANYIDAFIENLDWQTIEKTFRV